jgi:hypothetical protein
MARYGYRDANGEIVQTNQIGLAMWHPYQPRLWYCTQCGIFMKLYNISLDLPATHWACLNCKKIITIKERDDVFELHIKLAKDKFDLHILEYDKESKYWKVESAVFIGDSRIGSKRKPIGETERQEILEKLQEVIQEQLLISFETFQDFFAE